MATVWFIILGTNRRADSIALIMKWNLARYVVIDLVVVVVVVVVDSIFNHTHNSFYWIWVSTTGTINASIDLLSIWAFLRFLPYFSLSKPFINEIVKGDPIRFGHLLELLHFNIIWLVHIIDSDELYFVTTTFRLLSKWLFNSVKWECFREFSSVTCSLPTAYILTLLYLLDSFSFRKCGAVDATNAQTHSRDPNNKRSRGAYKKMEISL